MRRWLLFIILAELFFGLLPAKAAGVLENLCAMTTTTAGTGTITLDSAVSSYLSFDDCGVTDGVVVTYTVVSGTDREMGRGTYTATGTTLSRDTVLESTQADAKITLSGTSTVFITVASEDIIESGDKGDVTISADLTGIEIDANAVTAAEIAANAVDESEIAADAVRASEIQADAVGDSELNGADAFDITGTMVFDSDAVRIDDTNASHQLILTPGSDLTANRVFTIVTGDAARTLTMGANATLNDADYGDITTSSSFTSWNIDSDTIGDTELNGADNFSITGSMTFDSDAVHIFDTNASHDLIITPGSDLTADRVLTLTTGDAARTVTISGNATISQDYSTTGNPTFANPTVTTLEVGAAATDATIARTGAGEATLEGDAIKHAGKQVMWIPAAAMKGNATSPASCGDTYDSGNQDVTLVVCAFDTGATEERADFSFAMPKAWNESTITYQALWTNTGGASTETVQWEVGCGAYSDDDALNAAMGSTVTQSDTWLAQNDMHITAESSAITIANTPAEGDFVVCRISRDTSVDNMAGDALLIGVRIFWTDNASTLAE